MWGLLLSKIKIFVLKCVDSATSISVLWVMLIFSFFCYKVPKMKKMYWRNYDLPIKCRRLTKWHQNWQLLIKTKTGKCYWQCFLCMDVIKKNNQVTQLVLIISELLEKKKWWPQENEQRPRDNSSLFYYLSFIYNFACSFFRIKCTMTYFAI